MQKFLQAKISPCLPPSAGARAALSDPPGRDTGTESQEISRCSLNWVNQVPYDVIAITPTFKLGASTVAPGYNERQKQDPSRSL